MADDKYLNEQTSKVNSMYDKLKSAQRSQAAAQRDETVRNLRKQLVQQLPQFHTQRAQADVAQVNNMNKLKEYMAGAGAFNSGDNLSRASNVLTQRTNTVNQINGDENAYKIAIQDAINEANKQYASGVSSSGLQYDAQKAQALMDLNNRLRSEEYQRSRDTIGDQRYTQQFDYQKTQDQRNYDFNREQYANAINQFLMQQQYQKQRDAVGDSRWQTEFDYNRSNADRQYNFNKEQADREYALQQQQLAAARANSANKTPSVSQQDAAAKANAQQLTGQIQTYLDSWASGKASNQNGRATRSDMLNYLKANSGILTQQGVDVNSLTDWVKKNYSWDTDSDGNWYNAE